MSQYLLLRDNKQSGPFSEEEMISKGFKPYDLIWVEGKSAGWRYPSELPEFKNFTPVIEEQPFDRFFKKPSQSDSDPVNSSPAETQYQRYQPAESLPSAPADKQMEDVSSATRKVFVTLPGKSQDKTRKASRDEEPVSVSSGIRQMPEKPLHNSPEVPVAATEKKELPPDKPESTFTSWGKSGISATVAGANHSVTDTANRNRISPASPGGRRRLNTVMIMRISIAASLILCGIVIGLLISGSRQHYRNDQLDQLVKKMQEGSVHKAIPVDNTTPDYAQAQTGDDQPGVQTDQPVDLNDQTAGNAAREDRYPGPAQEKKTALQHAAAPPEKKSAVQNSPGPPAVSPSGNSIQGENGNGAAPKDAVTGPVVDKGAKELARKNIFQQVDLQNNEYKVGLLGGISNLELTLMNNSLYSLDRVEVLVSYLGPEKKIVRQQTVMISDVAAGSRKTVAVPKSSRGVSITYNIVSINSKALGIASTSY